MNAGKARRNEERKWAALELATGTALPLVDTVGFRPAEVSKPETYVTLEDTHGLEGLARGERAEQELEAFRASHPSRQVAPPAALAIAAILYSTRKAEGGADARDCASLGWQVPVRGWCEMTGYRERAVQAAFAWLADEGLVRRFGDYVTVKHLTRLRPAGERLDLWLDAKGKARRWVQVYSVTYLTNAGAAWLERAGFDLAETRGHGVAWRRRGFLARVGRALAGLWRTVRRRLGGGGSVAVGAGATCTPYPAKQVEVCSRRGDDSQPTASLEELIGAESPPHGGDVTGSASAKPDPRAANAEHARVEGAPAQGGHASMGSASAKLEGSKPPPSALGPEWEKKLGLTAEGIAAGLAWEGGGLLAYAEVVDRCWTRTTTTTRAAPSDVPSGSRNMFGRRRVWRCRGCGAESRYKGATVRHAQGCTAVGAWHLARGPAVETWSPAMTAELAWPEDWEAHPELRPRLRRLFVPVAAELTRRIQARAAEARRAAEAEEAERRHLEVWMSKHPECGGAFRAPVYDSSVCVADGPPNAWGRAPLCYCDACSQKRRDIE
uniref:hypothetical protein n=1 Tax=Myxococcus fulvus TaxID=33 RepID=UPI0034E0DB52